MFCTFSAITSPSLCAATIRLTLGRLGRLRRGSRRERDATSARSSSG